MQCRKWRVLQRKFVGLKILVSPVRFRPQPPPFIYQGLGDLLLCNAWVRPPSKTVSGVFWRCPCPFRIRDFSVQSGGAWKNITVPLLNKIPPLDGDPRRPSTHSRMPRHIQPEGNTDTMSSVGDETGTPLLRRGRIGGNLYGKQEMYGKMRWWGIIPPQRNE